MTGVMLLSGASSIQARGTKSAHRSKAQSALSTGFGSRAEAFDYFKLKGPRSAKKAKAAFKANSSDEPLYDVEGVSKSYIVSASSYFNFYGYSFDYDFGGMVGNVVFEEGSDVVYLKNPISYLITDSYIQGTGAESVLSFQLPQPLFEEDGTMYYAHRMVKDEANSSDYDASYEVDDSVPYTFSIDADGVIRSTESGDGVILGLTDEDGNWVLYGDYDTTMTPFSKSVLTVDDLSRDVVRALEDWAVIGEDGSQSVRVADVDGKLYIVGINPDNANAVVVGDIDGNTVTFASEQYVGIDEDYNYYQFFCGMTVEEEYDEYYDETYYLYTPMETFSFTYDAENGKLSGFTGAIGVVGGDLTDAEAIEAYAVFTNPSIERTPDEISYVPKAAYDLNLYEDDTEALLEFSFDALNEDGWPLNEDNLYYRVYIDGELFTLSPNEYVDLSEPLTDIGYAQNLYDEDGYNDVYDGLDGEGDRYIYFYFDAANPGIQTVYKDGDDEYCSEIVYADGTAVKGTLADKGVASQTYYDLNGCKVARPQNGVYIKTVTFTDGTSNTYKVIVRK